MRRQLGLPDITLTTILVVATAILVLCREPALAQSLHPTHAVPAAPGKYDFHWEAYTVIAAQSGKAFYVFKGEFEGQQPIGIAALGENGKPEIFPIVSGAGAEELKASFERFKKAKGLRVTVLLRASVAAPIKLPPLPVTTGGQTPTVAFDVRGSQVLLSRGTIVDFLAASIEVTMPAALGSLPPIRIAFRPRVEGSVADQAGWETGVMLNGNPIEWQRKGPLWDALKDLVLDLALARAGQAAQIAANASERPVDAPDYVALVAEVTRHLN